jgi:hypothetical protein
MNSKVLGALAALLMFLNTTHISAHHAFSAEFDEQKPVKLSGTITEVKWTNPHAWLNIETKDQNGSAARWSFELGSPAGLAARCWAKSDLKIGDQVTVEGYRAKNGSNTANATWISLPSGGMLYAGFQETPGAPAKFCAGKP